MIRTTIRGFDSADTEVIKLFIPLFFRSALSEASAFKGSIRPISRDPRFQAVDVSDLIPTNPK